jgi:hypothetical protein
MDNIPVWFWKMLMVIPWLEFIKTVAPVVTAIVAFRALKNWQRQDKAKRAAEFLDSLIDAVHAFTIDMSRSVSLFELTKMGIEAHSPTWETGTQEEIAIKGAIAYIQKRGKDEANRLAEALGNVNPAIIRLRTLAAKGQVFRFKDFAKCQNGIDMLSWQFDRIEAFTALLASSTLNWDHPEVQKTLKNVIKDDAGDIRKQLAENNVAILHFSTGAYQSLYG